jgi:transcriptional regulator with XRE-family HTH domain
MKSLKTKPTGRERIALNLRALRKLRGFSQENLSAGAGISQTFLSQIEGCRKNVSVDTLESLCLVLEADISELFVVIES